MTVNRYTICAEFDKQDFLVEAWGATPLEALEAAITNGLFYTGDIIISVNLVPDRKLREPSS